MKLVAVNTSPRVNWTMFDADAKKERHETVFPQEKQAVYELGAAMARGE